MSTITPNPLTEQLFESCLQSKLDEMKLLIESKADPNATYNIYSHYISDFGYTDDAWYDIDINNSLLFASILSNSIPTIDYVIEQLHINNIDNITDRYGITPLLLATVKSNINVVRHLINKFSLQPFNEYQFKSNDEPKQLLHIAAECNNNDLIQYFATFNFNMSNFTPTLYTLIKNNNYEMVIYLYTHHYDKLVLIPTFIIIPLVTKTNNISMLQFILQQYPNFITPNYNFHHVLISSVRHYAWDSFRYFIQEYNIDSIALQQLTPIFNCTILQHAIQDPNITIDIINELINYGIPWSCNSTTTTIPTLPSTILELGHITRHCTNLNIFQYICMKLDNYDLLHGIPILLNYCLSSKVLMYEKYQYLFSLLLSNENINNINYIDIVYNIIINGGTIQMLQLLPNQNFIYELFHQNDNNQNNNNDDNNHQERIIKGILSSDKVKPDVLDYCIQNGLQFQTIAVDDDIYQCFIYNVQQSNLSMAVYLIDNYSELISRYYYSDYLLNDLLSTELTTIPQQQLQTKILQFIINLGLDKSTNMIPILYGAQYCHNVEHFKLILQQSIIDKNNNKNKNNDGDDDGSNDDSNDEDDENNFNPNILNDDEENALHVYINYCETTHKRSILDYLITILHVDYNIPCGYDNITPFELAYNAHLPYIWKRLLRQYNVNPLQIIPQINNPNEMNIIRLEFFKPRYKNELNIEYFIQYCNHINLDEQNYNHDNGNTYLLTAANGQQYEHVKLLIEKYNVNIYKRNNNGWNILHFEAKTISFHFSLTEMIIERVIDDIIMDKVTTSTFTTLPTLPTRTETTSSNIPTVTQNVNETIDSSLMSDI